jgi:membrane fusion protein (multidrug efflux system)
MSGMASTQRDEQWALSRERGGATSLGRGWAWRSTFRRTLGGVLLALLSVVIAVSVYLWRLHSLVSVSTDNSYVVGNITAVSSEIGGQVVALYTDDNRLVEAGSPLAQIDPVPYQIAVDQAVADLAQARSDAQAARLTVELTDQDRSSLLLGAQAKVAEYEQMLRNTRLDEDNKRQLVEKDRQALAALQVQVPGAEALVHNALDYRDRFGRLAASGSVPIQARDDKEAAYQDAKAKANSLLGNIAAAERQMEADRVLLDEAKVKIEQTQRALDQTQAALGQAQASQIQPRVAASTAQGLENKITQAEAKLRQARLQLGYALVRASRGGIVSRRTIQLGQTITPRQAFLSLVPLDPENVWVVASLREDQMGRVRVGQPVTIRIDAIPDRTFTGYVESVAGGTGSVFSLFPPDNATGNFTRVVQRLPVRVRFVEGESWDQRVRPGMSATVTIDTTSAAGQGRREW